MDYLLHEIPDATSSVAGALQWKCRASGGKLLRATANGVAVELNGSRGRSTKTIMVCSTAVHCCTFSASTANFFLWFATWFLCFAVCCFS
jgi:hypothetical protein